MSDGELKRQLQRTSSENFNNGRSENKKRRTDSDRLHDNFTESTDVQQRQRGGLLGGDQARTTRKKPRYLSAAE